MKRTVTLLTIATTSLLLACGNHENSSNEAAKQENNEKFDSTNVKGDAKFAVNAATGGMMEVELGKVAMSNGSARSVKDFGQSMVTDHSKANDELRSLAAGKNISLPSEPTSDMQKKIDDLKKKHGSDFDKAYIDLMVSDHKEDIDEFKKEADNGNDADVKAWASGKIPTLQHHLQMAQDAQSSLGR